jgi:hypothetical protein
MVHVAISLSKMRRYAQSERVTFYQTNQYGSFGRLFRWVTSKPVHTRFKLVLTGSSNQTVLHSFSWVGLV